MIMEQSKENVLSALYALRSGLSAISEENDKFRAVKIKNLETVISTGCKMQPYLNELVVNPYYGCIEQWNSFKSLAESFGYGYWKSVILTDLFGEAVNQSNKKEWLISQICNSLNANLLKPLSLRQLYRAGEEIPFNLQFLEWDNNDITARAMSGYICAQGLKSGQCEKSLKTRIVAQQQKLFGKKHSVELQQMLPALSVWNGEMEDSEKRTKEELKVIQGYVEQFYNALQIEFSPVLDVRDWQYLDLVIYYFETRRADTVKEALQLVDREMQTQRLENLIIAATKQICNTLAIGFATLQNTMVTCFNALSAQIAQSTVEVSSQLSGLTSAVKMSNALKSKANVSSEQLMKDVLFIRSQLK